MTKPIVDKNYVSVRLDLSYDLNDWVNAISRENGCSKRKYLMGLIEDARKGLPLKTSRKNQNT